MSRLLITAGGLLSLLVTLDASALDPTLPPARPSATHIASDASPLRLQAILRLPQGARAVINGQSLKVGEQLADARVLAIDPHSVLIEREGKREELRLSAPIFNTSRTQP
ncbi:Type II secretory pathway component [Stutzerimonas nitrititolerans]|uniref:Type II secretory pathway component n=1 Tax=Stutzerimonas nitrititolerans TaxID=2482751 RepID=UPI0028B0152D|nr:Type II secretory pathway component [Stutzerimonas nitrititolerans]